jgi:hypothetical protein
MNQYGADHPVPRSSKAGHATVSRKRAAPRCPLPRTTVGAEALLRSSVQGDTCTSVAIVVIVAG